MDKRNESVAETRQRIVDAAVELHGTVGPANTTIAAIADAAGVTRLTVYRHFADADALFAACSAHWMSQQTPPRPDAWAEISDPIDRLRAALSDSYRFYAEGEAMLVRVRRDIEHVPAPVRDARLAREEQLRDVVLSAFTTRGATKRRRLAAVVGHALDFDTWRSLCGQRGLEQAEAVEVMVALVESIAAGDARRRTA
jgi:AcrR family transcriptional regulator